jgi:hypothetical protein
LAFIKLLAAQTVPDTLVGTVGMEDSVPAATSATYSCVEWFIFTLYNDAVSTAPTEVHKES